MKYREIQKTLDKLIVFSTQEMKILDDKYEKSKIAQWKKLGHIRQIVRGFYISGNIKINQNMLFIISNKIYAPSYISLEMALSYYCIIPEQVFAITAVSTKKTISYDTELGSFYYKKIKSELFWGYRVIQTGGRIFLIAELEKAIVDYLYLNDKINTTHDFIGLRWNKDSLRESLDREKLTKYVSMLSSPVVTHRIKVLLTYIQHD